MDHNLDTLLELHGSEVTRADGYWWKIEVWRVAETPERPHGIRYNLTLHNKYNTRVFGLDNAHAIKLPKKYSGRRIEYDHQHKSASDKGSPYEFTDAATLLEDFFEGIDKTIEKIEGSREVHV